MVHKCFNPACSAPFLYMHEGKLFRVEKHSVRAASDGGVPSKGPSRIEFFWLCEACARSMSINMVDGRGVLVQKLAFARKAAS